MSEPEFFRKRPVVIQAIQWTGFNLDEVYDFCPEAQIYHDNTLVIPTLEGNITAQRNDWIIKGVQGEFYPCKPDIFKETYEKV